MIEDWKASESVIAERRVICDSCDKYVEPVKICTECNCFVPFKTSVSFFECPLLKWNVVSTTP